MLEIELVALTALEATAVHVMGARVINRNHLKWALQAEPTIIHSTPKQFLAYCGVSGVVVGAIWDIPFPKERTQETKSMRV